MKYFKGILVLVTAASVLMGCESKKNTEPQKSMREVSRGKRQQEIFADSERIAEGCQEIYEKAMSMQDPDRLGLKQEMAGYFEEAGLSAVDTENQIDMVCAEKIEKFIGNAREKQEGKATIFAITDGGGFVRYDMETQNGEIDVIVSSCTWEKGKPKADYYHEFQAHTWNYTENGYFFIEDYHPAGYDGEPGHTGFRVKPLDKTQRELNRKYVLPVGYESNQLLITDWGENHYGSLDFYDLYERMYRMKYGEHLKMEADPGGAEYEIPKRDFEKVIQTYMEIDRKVLEENTVYHKDSQTYRYRPRGQYDSEFPYEPYPEVTAYEEMEDGTLRLTVNAVWAAEETDRAVTSELIVRPMENGDFRYISNRMVTTPDSIEPRWYTKRL